MFQIIRRRTICFACKGEPLTMSDRVLDTAGHPIAGATVDARQTNDGGFYDVQQKGIQPNCPYREQDAVCGVTETPIGDFRKTGTPAAPQWELDWDFTLGRAP